MSETKTEYLVEFQRRGQKRWEFAFNSADKEKAEAMYSKDLKRFPQLKHRLIRITVLKESK